MTSETKPAKTIIGGGVYYRLTPIGLLLFGCALVVIPLTELTRSQWARHPPVAYLAVVAFISIWLFYRICRMGVRFDDHGVTVRKIFRTYRFGWPEVSHFADGKLDLANEATGGRFWALKIVLRNGRAVTVGSTVRLSPSPKVLATIGQVAAHYQIPGPLTGNPSI
jgi:hypothetical protein